MTNFTPEMIEKAKGAKSAQELLELAKAGGVELTAQEAEACYAQLNPQMGELGEDDLNMVSGGGCGSSNSGPADYGFPEGRLVCTDEGSTICCICENYRYEEHKDWHYFHLRWAVPYTSYVLKCTRCGKIHGPYFDDPKLNVHKA